VPEPEEIPVILRGAKPDEFATFVRIALATGRRREDLLGLRLVDVKRDESALVFDERVVLQRKTSVLTVNRRKILATSSRSRPSTRRVGPPICSQNRPVTRRSPP
jgi:integrase